MLASSSKRAISSTTTVTSLPFCAASQQRLHQDRVGAGAIDGHLDRHHLGIGGRLFEQFDHRH
jgi:hypothetical protein